MDVRCLRRRESFFLMLSPMMRRWCPSCKFVEPLFEELARTHGHAIAFLKVSDIAQHRSLMQTYEVTVSLCRLQLG